MSDHLTLFLTYFPVILRTIACGFRDILKCFHFRSCNSSFPETKQF